MPRFSIAAFAITIALPLLGADDAPVATILCYHEVDSAPSHETIPRRTASGDKTAESLRYTASVEQFREELDYLEQNDYHVIPLTDLVAYLRGDHRSLPPKAVVITVDDGWLCAYTQMAPELRRRNMPWTLFVYPKIVGRGSHALTWPLIAEMAAGGVDIESHTYTHSFLTLENNGSVKADAYAAFLNDELVESRKMIEEKTEEPVRFLSYPYGDYDPTVIGAAEAGGYEAAVTTRRAPVTHSTSPLALPRYLIHNDTTLEEFKTFLVP